MPTTYEVRYGGGAYSVALRFADCNDAVVRFAEAVVRLDADPDFPCASAQLLQRWRGYATYLATWTKTSNERPTPEGEAI